MAKVSTVQGRRLEGIHWLDPKGRIDAEDKMRMDRPHSWVISLQLHQGSSILRFTGEKEWRSPTKYLELGAYKATKIQ